MDADVLRAEVKRLLERDDARKATIDEALCHKIEYLRDALEFTVGELDVAAGYVRAANAQLQAEACSAAMIKARAVLAEVPIGRHYEEHVIIRDDLQGRRQLTEE